jgi:hypothetical protein
MPELTSNLLFTGLYAGRSCICKFSVKIEAETADLTKTAGYPHGLWFILPKI